MTFYPRAGSVPMVDPITQGTARGSSLSIEFERPSVSAGHPAVVSGVLEATFPGERKPAFWEIRTPIPAAR